MLIFGMTVCWEVGRPDASISFMQMLHGTKCVRGAARMTPLCKRGEVH